MSRASATLQRTSQKVRRAFDPFLVVCSPKDLTEAVHALYYLPENYSLMVVSDSTQKMADTSWIDSLVFKNRIQFNDKETPESVLSLFSSADAVVDDGEKAQVTQTPRVVMSATVSGITPNADGFTVQTHNPEALASALLFLARNNN